MKCLYCEKDMIWQNDYMFEDEGIDEEGIIKVFLCPNEECNSFIKVYKNI